MSVQLELSEILKLNPHINRRELEEACEMSRTLSEAGLKRREYDLAPPLGVRRPSSWGDAGSDRRVVHLK